jgi:hypothetical protein
MMVARNVAVSRYRGSPAMLQKATVAKKKECAWLWRLGTRPTTRRFEGKANGDARDRSDQRFVPTSMVSQLNSRCSRDTCARQNERFRS